MQVTHLLHRPPIRLTFGSPIPTADFPIRKGTTIDLTRQLQLAIEELRSPAGALEIRVEDPDHIGRGVVEIFVDGSAIEGATVAFPTDESVRNVEVRLRQLPVSETPMYALKT